MALLLYWYTTAKQYTWVKSLFFVPRRWLLKTHGDQKDGGTMHEVCTYSTTGTHRQAQIFNLTFIETADLSQSRVYAVNL